MSLEKILQDLDRLIALTQNFKKVNTREQNSEDHNYLVVYLEAITTVSVTTTTRVVCQKFCHQRLLFLK